MPRNSGGQHSTLHDVAQAAGVSVSTAARVLRGSDYPVADELQRRVRAAAQRLRYVPNLLAKRLRGGAHPSIGLIVGNMLDPYFGEIAQAVTVAAQRRSLLAIVANMQRDPQLELGMIRELWEHRVNGLILAGGGFDQITYKSDLANILRQVRRSGITVVSLAKRGLPLPVFSVDNEAVGAMLAEHGLAHGHREIAIAAGPANSHVTQERLKGSRRVLDVSLAHHHAADADRRPHRMGMAHLIAWRVGLGRVWLVPTVVVLVGAWESAVPHPASNPSDEAAVPSPTGPGGDHDQDKRICDGSARLGGVSQ